MTVVERVRELVEPLLSARDLDLYDVEMAGPVLRVVVDRSGPLDLDDLGDATRAVGEQVKVKLTAAAAPDERRVEGELVGADGEAFTVRTGADDAGAPVERQVAYDDVERARTIFQWGPAGKPGGRRSNEKKRDHRS